MGIRFGGDMDDMNDPASPFMPRPDVEAMAADLLGQMDDNRERQNTAEIAFIDQWVGTKFNGDGWEPLGVMTAYAKACIKVMYETREELQHIIDYGAGIQGEVWRALRDEVRRLSELIPADYPEERNEDE